ncbi:MAG: L-aspartate oxidase [Acidimicrobiia bacterium]|nr:L-aspartate oxidase [Acidimicrobiia bacterium]
MGAPSSCVLAIDADASATPRHQFKDTPLMVAIELDHPLVIGSGVGGLSTALELPEATVLSQGLGSTDLAQGGIAAAVGPDDTPRLHAHDTLEVGKGLSVTSVVEILCEGGPEAITRLTELGARFGRRSDGTLQLGLEAGHRRRRIVTANGDGIGREVSRTLQDAVRAHDSIHLLDGWTVLDLLTHNATVTGVVAADPRGSRHLIVARGVVLASGGLGHLYSHTTNPPHVDGSGIAMAARAGAKVSHLEFVQFHPTALDIGRDPMPLVTEALRGEGALLVDDAGSRFMVDAHPDTELAPRDHLSRAVWKQLRDGRKVYLDARHIPDVGGRFPTVTSHATSAGLHPGRDLLPVSPAAHYLMGGISVDDKGRTSLHNLWAVGEAANTGVHGANRLASNSLLEGLVFAARVSRDVMGHATKPSTTGTAPEAAFIADLEDDSAIEDLRSVMWEEVGVVRTASSLQRATTRIEELRAELANTIPGRTAVDLVTRIVTAAWARTESRGSHYRADFPQTGSDE